jgi:hypothetical protein
MLCPKIVAVVGLSSCAFLRSLNLGCKRRSTIYALPLAKNIEQVVVVECGV